MATPHADHEYPAQTSTRRAFLGLRRSLCAFAAELCSRWHPYFHSTCFVSRPATCVHALEQFDELLTFALTESGQRALRVCRDFPDALDDGRLIENTVGRGDRRIGRRSIRPSAACLMCAPAYRSVSVSRRTLAALCCQQPSTCLDLAAPPIARRAARRLQTAARILARIRNSPCSPSTYAYT